MDFTHTPNLDKDDESRGDSETDECFFLAHRAAAAGNVTLLMDAVNHDPSALEFKDEKGMTPLSIAVSNQRLDLVKLLVKMGADINTQDSLGRTPLCLAAYEAWYDGVVYLLRSGAKQSIPDKHGRLPLHAATCDKDSKSLSALLQMLSLSDINEPDSDGMTALHWAAFHNRPEHVQLLMLRGGDIYRTDVDMKTPMHWASQNGSVISCSIMAQCHSGGAQLINTMEETGKTCVHLAAAAGHVSILEVFAHIPDVDFEVPDPDERLPIHWAAVKGNLECVMLLIQLGVDLSSEDLCSRTPLGYAQQAQQVEIIQVLKEHGATLSKVELQAVEKSNSVKKKNQDGENGSKTNENNKKSKFSFFTGWLDKRKNKSKDSPDIDIPCEDLLQEIGPVETPRKEELEMSNLKNSNGTLHLNFSPSVASSSVGSSSLGDRSPQGRDSKSAHGGLSPIGEISASGSGSSTELHLKSNSLGLNVSPRGMTYIENHLGDNLLCTTAEVSPRSSSSNQSDCQFTLQVPNLNDSLNTNSSNSASRDNTDHSGKRTFEHRASLEKDPSFIDPYVNGQFSFPRYNPLPDPFLLNRHSNEDGMPDDEVPTKPLKPLWRDGPDDEVLQRQAQEILAAQRNETTTDDEISIEVMSLFPHHATNLKLAPIPRKHSNTASSRNYIPSPEETEDKLQSQPRSETKNHETNVTPTKETKEKASKKRRKQRRKEKGLNKISEDLRSDTSECDLSTHLPSPDDKAEPQSVT